MKPTFTKSETMKFIELYKSYSYLWNMNSQFYKNKQARERAYYLIIEKMGHPKLKTITDVKTRIKNMRSIYCHERNKIMEGKIIKSSLSWYDMFEEIMSQKAKNLEVVPDNTLNLMLSGMDNNTSMDEKKSDEFQLFSDNIAAQLRNMPLDKALLLQQKIHKLVSDERIKLIDGEGDPLDSMKCEVEYGIESPEANIAFKNDGDL